MTTLDADTLAALPEPHLVVPHYEAMLAEKKSRFVAKARELGVANPEPHLEIEGDPITILLEEDTVSDLYVVDYINARDRSRLAYFAPGADLDHVAELKGVTRFPGESDASVRRRLRIAYRGSSSAGPDDWVRRWAQAADENVAQVGITRAAFPIPRPGETRGTIYVWILAKSAGGQTTAKTLQNVRDMLNRPDKRPTTREIIVRPAERVEFSVTAKVWLQADAQDHVFDGLNAHAAERFTAAQKLGRSLPKEWISAQLVTNGVAKAEIDDLADVNCRQWQAPLLTGLNLTMAGRI